MVDQHFEGPSPQHNWRPRNIMSDKPEDIYRWASDVHERVFPQNSVLRRLSIAMYQIPQAESYNGTNRELAVQGYMAVVLNVFIAAAALHLPIALQLPRNLTNIPKQRIDYKRLLLTFGEAYQMLLYATTPGNRKSRFDKALLTTKLADIIKIMCAASSSDMIKRTIFYESNIITGDHYH